MKPTLSILFSLLLTINIYSQEKFDAGTTKSFYVDINKETFEGTQKIPFKQIIVKDYRFDTTKIGYILDPEMAFGSVHKKIKFKNNSSDKLTEIVNKYFKNNLTSSSKNDLVIFVKSHWIQKGASDLNDDDKIRDQLSSYEDMSGVCTAEFDIFNLNNDHYIPLFRIKDDFIYKSYKPNQIINLLLLPFDSVIRKISVLNIENSISNKKNYDWPYLDSVYSNRFNVPIIKTSEYKKGIFVDFESFKQNKVVYPDFIFKQSDVTDEVYINNNELLIEYWGFFDGKDFFIHIGMNCFKLWRQNNTWDTFGDKYITVRSGEFDYRGIKIKTRKKAKVIYHPLQLNMETGKVY